MKDNPQKRLEFPPRAPKKQLSEEEQRRLFAATLKKFGIDELVNFDALEFRPILQAFLEELLQQTGSQRPVLQAGTGSGKTVLFILLALSEFVKNNRVLYLVPKESLVNQCAERIPEFAALDQLKVERFTKAKAPSRRHEEHAKSPDWSIGTPGVILNDYDHVNWEGIRLLVIDESQEFQGNYSGIKLLEKLSAEHPEIRVLIMSATPAASPEKFNLLRYYARSNRVLVAPTVEEMARLEEVTSEKWGEDAVPGLVETPFEISIGEYDPRLKRLCHELTVQACRCATQISEVVEQSWLWEHLAEVRDLRIPTFRERAALRSSILACSGDQQPRLWSQWAEMNKWCSLFNRAATMGWHSFLEHWFYLYAKRNVQPGLYLRRIEGEKAVSRRGQLSAADQRVITNPEVRSVIEEEVYDSPFEMILRYDNWLQILQASDHYLKGCVDTHVASRRHRMIDEENKRGSDVETARARLFFDWALSFCAQRERTDHPKIRGLFERLDQFRGEVTTSRNYIFTASRRHAEFLAEALEHRRGASGIKPVAAHGAGGPLMDELRRSAIAGFRGEDYNVFVTHPAFAGTGLDVKNPYLASFYSLPDSNPVNFIQSKGRVVGRAMMAMVDVFSAKETLEICRYWTATRKANSMTNFLLGIGAVVLPAYEAKS